MTNGTFLICSALAIGIGFMLQQSIENMINASLVLAPFNIKTIS